MNKRWFIRGIGVGMLMSAIILGCGVLINDSDHATIKRAKALGMVFDNHQEGLFDTPVPSSANGKTAIPKTTKQAKTTESPKQTATPKPADTTKKQTPSQQLAEEKAKLEKEKEKIQKSGEASIRKLTIRHGEWSMSVSRQLQELGVISSAKQFDKYLNNNGYSTKISVGTYSVSTSDSYRELAEKITGN